MWAVLFQVNLGWMQAVVWKHTSECLLQKPGGRTEFSGQHLSLQNQFECPSWFFQALRQQYFLQPRLSSCHSHQRQELIHLSCSRCSFHWRKRRKVHLHRRESHYFRLWTFLTKGRLLIHEYLFYPGYLSRFYGLKPLVWWVVLHQYYSLRL